MALELGLFALVVLVTACIAAGVCAAVVHTWALRALAFDLETRLGVVEGTLQREVKARAGQERWKRPAKDEELAKELLALKGAASPPKNWWETALPRSANGS